MTKLPLKSNSIILSFVVLKRTIKFKKIWILFSVNGLYIGTFRNGTRDNSFSNEVKTIHVELNNKMFWEKKLLYTKMVSTWECPKIRWFC